jgi:hypothetical protein
MIVAYQWSDGIVTIPGRIYVCMFQMTRTQPEIQQQKYK